MNKKVIIEQLESAGITFISFFLLELAAVVRDWDPHMITGTLVVAAIVAASRAAIKAVYIAFKPKMMSILERVIKS